jgi:hypothetical protein
VKLIEPPLCPVSRWAALMVLIALAGCAGGEVHPRFFDVRPRTLSVLSVKNDSGQALESVSFDGALHSAMVGARVSDLAELIRGAVEETLVLKGYEIVDGDGDGGSNDDDNGLSEHATLHVTVTAWSHSRGSGAQFRLRYRIEVQHALTGDLLYDGDFQCAHQPRAGTRRAPVGLALRRCVRQALDGLPGAP